ncbi:hypothetical protein J1G44_09750 [Cellulomonas sp. zg-ZUI199]|uniref:HTH merR-type domain-containing protein n=1 Tax=Cellulomonas wangleii TaxID=2816956 RepID=A0ABX8D7E8_9CELL|nr:MULTISPECIES: hypothetical protein [Cellulomonas]MBO0901367.1 hypothetical protein [Cellulomonas sp. zg-ZUI22]MBO0924765.1 hypothetical protein [Cellulomonas wangleii]QVI62943.1 hypothetical protein KG103_03155 [Cellulomonas wangleii]
MPADVRPDTARTAAPPSAADGGGLDDLYDIARLARRLDVEHATIRVWLSRKVPWLPPPDGRLNGGAVWRASTLEGIEERRFRRRPGRKPRFTSAPAAADVPRTGSIPVVAPRTGAVPLVTAPRVGAEPPAAGPLVAAPATAPTVAANDPSHAVGALTSR